MANVIIFDHPLIQHKLSILRDKSTGTNQFRALISEIAMLMCYEATRDLPLTDVDVMTPMGICHAKQMKGRKLDALSRLNKAADTHRTAMMAEK